MFNSDPVLLKARKVHRCTWCGENIEPGATYKRWVTFDAGAFTSKMHPECDGAAAEEFAEWGYDEGYLPFQNERPAAIPSGGVTVPVTITENGVAKVKASDVLKTPEAQKQLDAVKRLRDGVALPDGGQQQEGRSE